MNYWLPMLCLAVAVSPVAAESPAALAELKEAAGATKVVVPQPAAPVAVAAGAPDSHGGMINLRNSENGRTFHVRKGDIVNIWLEAPNGFNPFRIGEINASVLKNLHWQPPVRYGVSVARYEAIAKGSASIVASATKHCDPGTACPALAAGWHVNIIVDSRVARNSSDAKFILASETVWAGDCYPHPMGHPYYICGSDHVTRYCDRSSSDGRYLYCD